MIWELNYNNQFCFSNFIFIAVVYYLTIDNLPSLPPEMRHFRRAY